jgi:hypothetical protein
MAVKLVQFVLKKNDADTSQAFDYSRPKALENPPHGPALYCGKTTVTTRWMVAALSQPKTEIDRLVCALFIAPNGSASLLLRFFLSMPVCGEHKTDKSGFCRLARCTLVCEFLAGFLPEVLKRKPRG